VCVHAHLSDRWKNSKIPRGKIWVSFLRMCLCVCSFLCVSFLCVRVLRVFKCLGVSMRVFVRGRVHKNVCECAFVYMVWVGE